MSVNYFYVTELSEELMKSVEQLPLPDDTEDVSAQVEQIRQKWLLSRRYVQITVNHAEIELISNAATELYIFARHMQTAEFERARHILISSLENLKSSEKLSPINIL
jgi:hypothetical protein